MEVKLIEEIATALVREYLSSKGLTNTLDTLETEQPRRSGSICKRTVLAKMLHIDKLIKRNKEDETPLRTILEVMVKYFLEKNNEIMKTDNVKSIPEKRSKRFGSQGPMKDPAALHTVHKRESTSVELLVNPTTSDRECSRQSVLRKELDLVTAAKPQKSGQHRVSGDSRPKTTCNAGLENNRLKAGHSASNTVRPKTMAGDGDLRLDDLDDIETQSGILLGNRSSLTVGASLSGTCVSNTQAKDLKKLMFGSVSGNFNEEWKRQSFLFSDKPDLQYGIVQQKGGPCGVLACIQSYIVHELLFSSERQKPVGLHPNKTDQDWALEKGISAALWKAGQCKAAVVALPSRRQALVYEAGIRGDGITETLMLFRCASYTELTECVKANLQAFKQDCGCIAFLYSAVFSRGIENVRSDMDESDGKLIGAHGYCTQEIVNLLLTGRAVSNVFDGVLELDSGGEEKSILQGISTRSQFGFLSLFEHYNSCVVGKNLKYPSFPIWVVCSESHFTVLFSTEHLVDDTNQKELKQFQLVYYDGLARQDCEIRLIVDTENDTAPFLDGDLTPPLEHCVRTKWRNAFIKWQGSEPLL